MAEVLIEEFWLLDMKRMTEVAISEGQLDEWNGEAKAGHQSLSMTKSYGKSSYNESAGVVSTPVGEPKSSLGSTHSIAETSSAHASSVPMQASLKSASSMPSSGSMVSSWKQTAEIMASILSFVCFYICTVAQVFYDCFKLNIIHQQLKICIWSNRIQS